jgi:hypothetical protein
MLLHLLGGTLISISLGHSYFQKMIDVKFSKEIPGSYFFCLIDSSISYEDNIRKIKDLPGIERVTQFSSNQIQAQIKEMLGDINDPTILDKLAVSYVGIRVEFEDKTTENSQNLIREYVRRLIGETNLTIGPTINPFVKDFSSLQYNDLMVKYSLLVAVLISLIIWLLIYSMVVVRIRELAFLVEKFQRKKLVSFKIVSLCLVIQSLISLPFIYYLISAPSSIAIMVIAIIFIILSSFELKASKWKN